MCYAGIERKILFFLAGMLVSGRLGAPAKTDDCQNYYIKTSCLMSLRAYIAGLVLAVAAAPASAAPTAYAESVVSANGFNSQGGLFRIDLATRIATYVGPSSGPGGLVNGLPPFNIRGLSFNPQGQLYAVSDDLKVLMQINRSTGAATLVGPLNLSGPGVATAQNLDLSMTFTCDGSAWLASAGTGNFWQVNTTTGSTTLVGSTGGTITGLAGFGNTVYATGSRTDLNLYTVNTSTAALTTVGAYGNSAAAVRTISPGFDADGQFWAILNNVGPNSPGEQWSNLAQISGNGALSKLGTITGPTSGPTNLQNVGLTGLAIAPPICSQVGDPSENIYGTPTLSWRALAVLILLLLAVAALRLRA